MDAGSAPLGAFGLYSSMRAPDATFKAWGGGGYLTGTVAAGWSGGIFVHGDLAPGAQDRLLEELVSRLEAAP